MKIVVMVKQKNLQGELELVASRFSSVAAIVSDIIEDDVVDIENLYHQTQNITADGWVVEHDWVTLTGTDRLRSTMVGDQFVVSVIDGPVHTYEIAPFGFKLVA